MSRNKDRKKASLVPSGKGKITIYLSKLTSRGLKLVKIVEQKQTKEPDNPLEHCIMAEVYGKLGSYSNAYKQAIRIDPDDAMAHYDLRIAYHKSGRYSEAIKVYKHAIQINPDFSLAHYNLGLVYLKGKG